MVFSMNSRQALQRVQRIPPTSYIFNCLKVNEKNLSTKTPKEDASKPPLRLNIPKDSPEVDTYSKFVRSAQPRSKSLISKPKQSFSLSIDDGLLYKSGSEMHFSSFRQDDALDEDSHNQEVSPNAGNIPGTEYSEESREQTYYQSVNHFYAPKEENEPNKETVNKLNAETFNEIFSGHLENESSKGENHLAETDESKNLYIVIDVPEKEKEKQFAYVDTCESIGESLKFKLPSFVQDDFKAVKSLSGGGKTPNIKVTRKRLEGLKGKTSQTKFSPIKTDKGKSNSKVKFEVREIEDAATYVFQLKFKKGLQGRTCAVGCVPEKEVNTRKIDISSPEAPMTYCSGAECRSKALREVICLSDPPEFQKNPEPKMKGRQKNEILDEDKSKSNSINPAKNDHNSSAYQAMDKDQLDNENSEATESVVTQSSYLAGENSNSQNVVDVTERNPVQPVDESNVSYGLAFQKAVSENSSNVTTVSPSAAEGEIVDDQNSKAYQPGHVSNSVHMTCDSNPNFDNSQLELSEIKPEENQTKLEESAPNPPTTILDTEKWDKAVKDRIQRLRKFEKRSNSGLKPRRDTRSEGFQSESIDFQTTSNIIRIRSDRPPTPQKYSAGLPKIINKTLKCQRKGFGMIDKEALFDRKCSHKSDLDSEMGTPEIFGNPLFFSTKETCELDSMLFKNKKDDILHVWKGKIKDEGPKMTDSMVNVANEDLTNDKGKASVDTLTMMKQLKEIVDFDLKNAVKIFEGREIEEKANGKVEDQEKEKTSETETMETKTSTAFSTDSQNLDAIKTATDKPEVTFDCPKETVDISNEPVRIPMCLPGKETNDGKIQVVGKSVSVVNFDLKTEKFDINVDELENAINHRRENFEESYQKAVSQGLEKILSNEDQFRVLEVAPPTHYELKSGDSILVFDEISQTWKVDFSILEKRKQQAREEEELTKRSELILETFEKLEQGNIRNIPKPTTRDRKTFDYSKEEWKVYRPDKVHSTNKSIKAKLPFKESDAEEIRKRNSDLYDDLFVANKKDAAVNKEMNKTPSTSDPKKISKSVDGKKEGQMMMSKKSDKGEKTDTPPKERPCERSGNFRDIGKDEDTGWESYVKEDIPPLTSDPKPIPNRSPGKAPPNIRKIDVPTVKVPQVVPGVMKIPPSKITPSKGGIKIDEPKFRIPLPFGRKKKIDEPKTRPAKTENVNIKDPKEKVPPVTGTKPGKPEEPSTKITHSSKVTDSKPVPPTEPPKGVDPKPKPPHPPSSTPVPPKSADGKVLSPATSTSKKEEPKSKMPPSSATNKDHYVSDNIVEMSKYTTKDKNPTNKSKQFETVKWNITSDTRIPSKITEINLNKKCDEWGKESSSDSKTSNSNEPRKPSDESKVNEKCTIENKTFYRNFEKYKTPFSDPEYEEKPIKIISDMDTNPNLKKLDNWNKTLVLQEAGKPSEHVESWLKDETDKMATLLLKVLQEAADGKPKRKPQSSKSKSVEKTPGKGNPYDNIRKKQENTPEGFLFKVRTVNFALGGEPNKKPAVQSKSEKKLEKSNAKEIPLQSAKTAKPAKVVDVFKTPETSVSETSTLKPSKISRTYSDVLVKEPKTKLPDITLDEMSSPWIGRDVESKISIDLSDDIPGPEILKKISGTWKMFPIIGCQATIFTLLRIFQLVNLGSSIWNQSNISKPGKNAFSSFFAKYGPIVNLQGPLSGNIVLLHKPSHLKGVFEQDAGFVVRSIFDSLEQSRREIEGKILPAGVSLDCNRIEWEDLKKASNDPLVKGCEKFFRPVEVAGECLLNNVRRNKNNQNFVSDDFTKEIKQWSMEGLCSVLFEKSFGFLEGRSKNTSWLLEPEKFFGVVEEATEYLSKCERGFQAWRLMVTPSSMNLNQAYRSFYTILSKQLYQAELNLKNKNELLRDSGFNGSHDLSFLESMLLNDGMTVEDIICNVIDIILIGVNTMSSAMSFMLYNLAQNVKVQSKLLKEVKETLPDKTSRLDYHKLHSLKYLQACLKESLRLNSPVPLFFRVLQNDVLVSNYVVPKDTFVVMDFKVSNMKESIFEDPDKFMPERWLRDDKWLQDINPISLLPFCHGPRAELAKRIVEMQLWSCIAKIVRNFQVEYHYGEIEGTEDVFSYPNKPLKLNFVEREE